MQQHQASTLREMARVFLEDFIEKYKWLEDLSTNHGWSPIVLQGLLTFLEKAPHLRKEKKNISLGLVIKNKYVTLRQSSVHLNPFHISEFYKFANLKNAVNGNTLCYIVDDKGIVTIGEIPKNLVLGNARLTLQSLSAAFNTITIYLKGPITFVYDSGSLAHVRRNGSWMKPCTIQFDQLIQKGFPEDLLANVLRLCCKMSEENEGGTFVIVKDNEPKHCHPMNSECNFEKKPLIIIPDNEVIGLAGLDGAVILNTAGELLMVGQKLDPPEIGEYHTQAGRGARHDSASKYSKATNSVAFVISDDGPITVFFEGNMIGKCFQELFGERT